MGGCFGCLSKPTPIVAVDKPSNGLRIQGRPVKKRTVSDDFWSTSTYDLENSAFQSQRSVSSISTSNQTLNQCTSTSGLIGQSDFVNQGLLLWNQTRLDWVGTGNPIKRSLEPRVNWNATCESLLATRNPFPQRIPLSQMVDFLVDVWEQEGLYDRNIH